ncbi:uncharacterized protein [Amphiura filiformis]|uniref:uncharacterized protein n=1 Tax=Amphiura filiformis TaxID=82378 RepID=UPI003B20BB44
MEYYHSYNSAENTSSRHKKTSPFSIERILGIDQQDQALPPPTPISASQLTASPVARPEIPAKSRHGLRRRPRTVYTTEQTEALESVFEANQYPDINSREALADALDMTEARVQVWFQNRRARLRRQAKRKTSSSPSDTSSSSTESEHRQMESPPGVPETANITTSQRYTQACCSPPPPVICTSASRSSCPPSSKTSYPVNLSSYGLPQQYGGAFAYSYYPHQYACHYCPSAYTTVTSAYQGIPICSVPKFSSVSRVEPVTNVVDVCQ